MLSKDSLHIIAQHANLHAHKPLHSLVQVVCTIHQPNSDITDTFDDWMLLSKGVVLYHGPWSEAVDYFQAHGFPCPMYKNPSDVFMKLASDTSIVKVLAELCNKHTRVSVMEWDVYSDMHHSTAKLLKLHRW